MLTRALGPSLNFRRPREPVSTQCTTVFFNANTNHISLAEISCPCETSSQGKVSFCQSRCQEGGGFVLTIGDVTRRIFTIRLPRPSPSPSSISSLRQRLLIPGAHMDQPPFVPHRANGGIWIVSMHHWRRRTTLQISRP